MESKFQVLDYIILVLILLLSIIVGLFHEAKEFVKNSNCFQRSKPQNKISDENIELKKVSNTSEDKTSEYLTGNASISPIPIAFSLLASFYSATALLGMPAEVYQYGIQYWIVVFGMMVTPIIGAYVTGPIFSKTGALSVFEYLEMRFESKRVRQLGMIYYVLRNFISSAIFMYGPATTLSYLTGLDQKIAIASIGVIGTFYTTIGGLRAVIWTDLFQALVMFVSLFFIIIKGLIDVGGFENLWEINSAGGRLNFFDFNPGK
jgi:Na+/proline symporter